MRMWFTVSTHLSQLCVTKLHTLKFTCPHVLSVLVRIWFKWKALATSRKGLMITHNAPIKVFLTYPHASEKGKQNQILSQIAHPQAFSPLDYPKSISLFAHLGQNFDRYRIFWYLWYIFMHSGTVVQLCILNHSCIVFPKNVFVLYLYLYKGFRLYIKILLITIMLYLKRSFEMKVAFFHGSLAGASNAKSILFLMLV